MLVSITGPECSGKSALASYLAGALQVKAVEEFARGYLSRNKGGYGIGDLDVIAGGQLKLVLDAGYPPSPDRLRRAQRDAGCFRVGDVVITDTFLLVILIWSLHKFGKVSDVVMKLYKDNPPDFYLLCRPDLPWQPDALRENEHGRDKLFEMYLEHIRVSGIPYFVVEGDGAHRMQTALQKVEQLFKN